MPVKGVITGQKVARERREVARQLRKQQTPPELILWQHLRAGRLPGLHFRRQQVIDGFIVDFYCHSAGLVIELDGAVHHRSDQKEYDQQRDEALQQHG